MRGHEILTPKSSCRPIGADELLPTYIQQDGGDSQHSCFGLGVICLFQLADSLALHNGQYVCLWIHLLVGGNSQPLAVIYSVSATGKLLSDDPGSPSFPEAEADNRKFGRATADARQTLNPPKDTGNEA